MMSRSVLTPAVTGGGGQRQLRLSAEKTLHCQLVAGGWARPGAGHGLENVDLTL